MPYHLQVEELYRTCTYRLYANGCCDRTFKLVIILIYRTFLSVPNVDAKCEKRLFQEMKITRLLAADYSQIELRIIAALSEEETMIEAFKNGEDIHASTASKVFNVPLGEVTREQRSNAKTVNFGIIYGVSAFGLSNQTRFVTK